jgi:hypothetical protein
MQCHHAIQLCSAFSGAIVQSYCAVRLCSVILQCILVLCVFNPIILAPENSCDKLESTVFSVKEKCTDKFTVLKLH